MSIRYNIVIGVSNKRNTKLTYEKTRRPVMKNIILSLALTLGLSLSFISYGCTYKDVDAESEYEDVDDDEVEVEEDDVEIEGEVDDDEVEGEVEVED
jgi:hypothetical protein